MKSLTAITGNMDDMDQTVLSVEEYARLMSNLGDLRLENIRLKQQLQALAEAGAASEDLQLMRLGYAAATVENEDLRARVQELGELARNNSSRRVMELEAQLEAIGAGGVEPLRRRGCLHHIEEPRGMVSP